MSPGMREAIPNAAPRSGKTPAGHNRSALPGPRLFSDLDFTMFGGGTPATGDAP